jgi:hypothetical protein
MTALTPPGIWSSKLTAIFEVIYPKIFNAGLKFPTLPRMEAL